MGLFNFFKKPSMDSGVSEFRNTPGAALIDVRTREEYAEGHVGGSLNIPLDEIGKVSSMIPGKDTPLFVHCRSGARSSQAVSELKSMGYKNVKNIGGMLNYSGKAER